MFNEAEDSWNHGVTEVEQTRAMKFTKTLQLAIQFFPKINWNHCFLTTFKKVKQPKGCTSILDLDILDGA